jgi:hypothetical protein
VLEREHDAALERLAAAVGIDPDGWTLANVVAAVVTDLEAARTRREGPS